MSQITKFYVNLLKKHPAATKITTGAFLVGVGDTIAQKVVEKQEKWDYARTARFAGIAFFIITPCTRTWVDVILPKLVPIKPGQKVTTKLALKKVGCDMFIFGPIITTMFVSLNMYFSGEVEKAQIYGRVREIQPEIISKAWCWWGPNQFINFKFVPAHLQASFIQIAALVWNTYLSWVSHRSLSAEHENYENEDAEPDKTD